MMKTIIYATMNKDNRVIEKLKWMIKTPCRSLRREEREASDLGGNYFLFLLAFPQTRGPGDPSQHNINKMCCIFPAR